MIRVMLVDDHALVRMGFRMLLADAEDRGCGRGRERRKGLPRLRRACRPDVVVLDLSMPGMGGLEAVRRPAGAGSEDSRVWLCRRTRTRRTHGAYCALARSATSAKRSAPDALIAAVDSGRHVATVCGRPDRSGRWPSANLDGDAARPRGLSEREFSVFIQLARGHSVAQIAETLSLSPSTVGTHLYHVKQKLGANNQSELTLVALRWGLIQV
jgi:two-component system invasion response regulator UvrY